MCVCLKSWGNVNRRIVDMKLGSIATRPTPVWIRHEFLMFTVSVNGYITEGQAPLGPTLARPSATLQFVFRPQRSSSFHRVVSTALTFQNPLYRQMKVGARKVQEVKNL